MPRKSAAKPENHASDIRVARLHVSDIREVLLETYAANGRMNQLILDHLDPQVWRAKLPGMKRGEGRTIAAIFAHMHNNRVIWLKWSAPHLKCPALLDTERCTMKQTSTAFRKSGAACLEMLKDALSGKLDRRVAKFSRGSWAPVWPAGATMFAYMFSHEAHHRGQVLAMAHALGFRLPNEGAYGIWHWERIWKDLGFEQGPR